MTGRLPAYGLLAIVVVAMLGPPLRQPPTDSYPLSTYPMFSHDRGSISSVATVVGVTTDDTVSRLSPQLIGGTDEVMLAVQTAAKAVRAGGTRADELCEQVAGRIAARGRTDLAAVEVRVEVHDAVSYFASPDREPTDVDVHARCEVPA